MFIEDAKKTARGSEVNDTPSDRRTSIGITNLWDSSISSGAEALREEGAGQAEASSVTEQRTRLEVEVKAERNKLFTNTAPLPIKRKLKNGEESSADGNDVIA
jgi:hypothetical protein